MAKSKADSKRTVAASANLTGGAGGEISWAWLTVLSLILLAGVVIARATLVEVLREPLPDRVVPGGGPLVRGAGPTAGLVLDVLCWLGGLLILLRRILDRQYVLRWHWSHVLVGALGLWAVLSPLWAADKFAALVGSFHFLTAAVVIWSFTQLVRSWTRLRLIGAICVGLLFVLVAQGFYYRFIDLPDQQRDWEQNRTKYLEQMRLAEGSFPARQFERKMMAGEMMGFSASPNTYAAMLVMLSIVAAGVGLHHAANKDSPATIAVALLILPLAGWLLYYTGSMTAAATPVLAAIALAAIARWRPWLAANSRRAYWIGAGVVLLGVAAVVGHGLWHGSLVQRSMTFRWRYWVGGADIFADHWFAGVGWDNFGLYYLGSRLAESVEEIRDPHNLFVRFFVELGIVGGLLAVGWIARLAWELTRPVQPPMATAPTTTSTSTSQMASSTRSNMLLLAGIGLAGVVIGALAAIDFSVDPYYALFEVLKRLLYLGALVVGGVVGSIRSTESPEFDERPAPWLLYALLVALAIFLLHNLVDFSFFEPGPMFVFAMIAGSVLGVRTPSQAGAVKRTRAAHAVFAAAAVAFFVLIALLVIPVGQAEAAAHQADEEIVAGNVVDGARRLRVAFRQLPINANYAYRAARAMIMHNAPPGEVKPMLAEAIAANPLAVDYRLTHARYELSQPTPQRESVVADFERALELNPNEVGIHVEYADALVRLGLNDRAREHYQRALDINAALPPDEAEKLPPEDVRTIEDKLRAAS